MDNFNAFASGINTLVDTNKANPERLRADVNKNSNRPLMAQSLEKLIALQIMDKELNAKLNQVRLSQEQPEGSVADRLFDKVLGQYTENVASRVGAVNQQKQAENQKRMQRMLGGVPPQMQTQYASQGGIVAFQEGTGENTVGDAADEQMVTQEEIEAAKAANPNVARLPDDSIRRMLAFQKKKKLNEELTSARLSEIGARNPRAIDARSFSNQIEPKVQPEVEPPVQPVGQVPVPVSGSGGIFPPLAGGLGTVAQDSDPLAGIADEEEEDSAGSNNGGVTTNFDTTEIGQKYIDAANKQKGKINENRGGLADIQSNIPTYQGVTEGRKQLRGAVENKLGAVERAVGKQTTDYEEFTKEGGVRDKAFKDELQDIENQKNEALGLGQFRKANALKNLQIRLAQYGGGDLTRSNRAANQAIVERMEAQEQLGREFDEKTRSVKKEQLQAKTNDLEKLGALSVAAAEAAASTANTLAEFDARTQEIGNDALEVALKVQEIQNALNKEIRSVELSTQMNLINLEIQKYDFQLKNAQNKTQILGVVAQMGGFISKALTTLETSAAIGEKFRTALEVQIGELKTSLQSIENRIANASSDAGIN
jgi:hypothetical protein